MDYFRVNESLYKLLSKVVNDTQILLIDDVSSDKISPYPRLEESKFIISQDILRTNASIITAHVLSEYRPSQLKLERLMRDNHKLLIDTLIEDIGGIRGVPIQSN